jgi:SOS response regulatory protein OraA/RecX
MGYVCDANIDCEDGYDENEELCAAANRPPIEDIMNFLEAEKGWIIDNIFAGRKIEKIAHSLVVSQRLDDFRQRLGMSHDEIQPLKKALEAIESGNARAMTSLGMPPSAWNEVSFIFSKLIKSGFTE